MSLSKERMRDRKRQDRLVKPKSNLNSQSKVSNLVKPSTDIEIIITIPASVYTMLTERAGSSSVSEYIKQRIIGSVNTMPRAAKVLPGTNTDLQDIPMVTSVPLPRYNKVTSRPGDKVTMPNGQVGIVPTLDADGQQIFDL